MAALVTMDDPKETATKYGSYTLKVTGPLVVGARHGG